MIHPQSYNCCTNPQSHGCISGTTGCNVPQSRDCVLQGFLLFSGQKKCSLDKLHLDLQSHDSLNNHGHLLNDPRKNGHKI